MVTTGYQQVTSGYGVSPSNREVRRRRAERSNLVVTGSNCRYKRRSNLSSGFGLLEVLLSASILALIAGATIGLASASVKTALLGANRTTATQLAQEGVEIVRAMRDTTYLDGSPNRWNQQPGQANSDVPDCSVSCSLVGPSASGNWTLASSPTSEAIALATGTATTTFTRTLQLKPIPWYGCPGGGSSCSSSSVPTIPNDSGASASSPATLAYQVVSTVSWFQNGRTITTSASTFLTDWRAVQ